MLIRDKIRDFPLLYENLGLLLEIMLIWLVSKVKNLGRSGVKLLNYNYLFLSNLLVKSLNWNLLLFKK